MAGNLAATSLTAERIRSAAKHLEQESHRVQSELHAHVGFFKRVAEEMETEHESEAVAMLRQGLLEVLDCAHTLKYQCSALQNVSQRFEAGTETHAEALCDNMTALSYYKAELRACSFGNILPSSFSCTSSESLTHKLYFSKHLNESTQQFLAGNPFDPTKDKFFQQFDRAIWNIHHAGEVAPGQEEEEIVVMNNDGLRNTKCPLSGKPVIELENPVRSTDCHHIYDEATVMAYIARAARKTCAVAGCPTYLKKDNLKCDASLKMEIDELRIREQATQMACYTELDLDE